jgi:hypothetical protein
MSKILFKETQRFNSWWIWLLIIVCVGFSIYPILDTIQSGIPFSNGQLMGIFVLILVLLLFILLKLETEIKEDGIYVRFFPFHWKPRFFAWENISHMEVKKYSALKEYGGWGIRFGRNGTAYNVKGNKGLQLKLNNKEGILIGTQRPEELEKMIKEIQTK